MDATNQKTLAGVLTTLLLGSLFVTAIAPVASATHLGAGEDIQIDVRNANAAATIEGVGTFTDLKIPSSPAGFKLRANTAYNLLIVGLDTTGSTGYGYTGAAAKVELVNTSTGTATSVIQADVATGPTSTTRNATFLLTGETSAGTGTISGAGVYELRPQGSTNAIARILFYPKEDITVSLATGSVTYSPAGSTVVTIRTTDSTGANMAAALTDCDVVQGSNTKACLGFLPGPNATSTDGTFTFPSALPMGVGNWKIYAFRNNTAATYYNAPNGDSIPERLANTSITVNPVTLGLSTIQSSAFVGFSSAVAYRATYPTTNNIVFKSAGVAYPADVTVSRINISLASPTGLNVAFNGTMIGTGTGAIDADATLTNVCWNTTLTTAITCGSTIAGATPAALYSSKIPNVDINRDNGDIWVNTSDDIDGTNVWAAGSYTLLVQLETAGGSTTAPEYSATTTFSPAAPASVNLQVTPVTVDVPAPATIPATSGTFNSAQGTQSVTLTISGNTAFRHPLCDRGLSTAACGDTVATGGTWEVDTQFADNITLRGAVLPGWNITSYTALTGVAALRFTPTANGTVWADVNWKNVTTSIALPVARGANITLDAANLTVDVTTTITASVKDAFGNPVSNAKVFVFPRTTLTSTTPADAGMTQASFTGTGTTVVFGTGAANLGQGGLYQFSLKATAVQDLVFVAETGSTGNLNYTYAPLTVLPNLDLSATLSVARTMAALRTQVVVNVTNTTGAGQTGTDANFAIFFLTPTQRANLLNNGTTALFTTGTIPVAETTAGSSSTGTVINITKASKDYSVYICSGTSALATITTPATKTCTNAIRDNRNNMPVFNVTAYNATFNPVQIANNVDIQGATSVNILVTDWNGTRATGTIGILTNGTLVTSGGSLTATVTNGEVNVTLTGANAGVGNIEWTFNPREPTGSDDLSTDRVIGSLAVVAGNLTFQPSKVPILQSTLVTVRLTNFAGTGLAGRVIRLCGVALNSNFPTTAPTTLSTTDQGNCPAIGTTEADGTTGIVVTPTSLTPITVYVNNSNTARTITVTAGTLTVTVSPTSPTAGQNVTLTATQPGGTPSVGSRILVTRGGTTVLDATADGSGQAMLAGTSVTEGTYVVTAIRSGFDNGTATFTVGAAPANASFSLSNLVLPSTISVGSPITVSVDVTNTGAASGTANAILLVNNAQRDTQAVTLDAGANTTVAYTFTPTVAGTYAVSVRIGTTTIGPQTITVGPITTTSPVTTTTAVTTTPPTSAVTTPPTSVVTTPTTVTTSPTTATPATTTPKVPGFEVVALIAALGVALLVLRRRS